MLFGESDGGFTYDGAAFAPEDSAFLWMLDPLGVPVAGRAFERPGGSFEGDVAIGDDGVVFAGSARETVDFGNGPLANLGATDIMVGRRSAPLGLTSVTGRSFHR